MRYQVYNVFTRETASDYKSRETAEARARELSRVTGSDWRVRPIGRAGQDLTPR
jgi:hypothetical protein